QVELGADAGDFGGDGGLVARRQLQARVVAAVDVDLQRVAFAGVVDGLLQHRRRGRADGDLRRGAVGRGQAQRGVQFAAAGHLHDDVAAADQLTADVQLRDRRPVAVELDAFADLRV